MAAIGCRTAKFGAAVPRDTVQVHDDIVFSNDVHQNNKFEWFPYLTYFNPCKVEEIGIAKNKNCMSKTLEMIMSTATMRRGEADAAIEFSTNPISAFVGRIIEAREAKAKRIVAGYLAACSDGRLMDLGLSTEDIRAIRTGTFQGVRS